MLEKALRWLSCSILCVLLLSSSTQEVGAEGYSRDLRVIPNPIFRNFNYKLYRLYESAPKPWPFPPTIDRFPGHIRSELIDSAFGEASVKQAFAKGGAAFATAVELDFVFRQYVYFLMVHQWVNYTNNESLHHKETILIFDEYNAFIQANREFLEREIKRRYAKAISSYMIANKINGSEGAPIFFTRVDYQKATAAAPENFVYVYAQKIADRVRVDIKVEYGDDDDKINVLDTNSGSGTSTNYIEVEESGETFDFPFPDTIRRKMKTYWNSYVVGGYSPNASYWIFPSKAEAGRKICRTKITQLQFVSGGRWIVRKARPDELQIEWGAAGPSGRIGVLLDVWVAYIEPGYEQSKEDVFSVCNPAPVNRYNNQLEEGFALCECGKIPFVEHNYIWIHMCESKVCRAECRAGGFDYFSYWTTKQCL